MVLINTNAIGIHSDNSHAFVYLYRAYFMEITLTSQNFDQEVLISPIPVLVDFWAQWCGPCHAIAPAVANLAQKYQSKLRVGKLNVDHEPQLAQKYGVRSIPNLKIFQNGKVVDEIIGAVPAEELEKRVARHIS